MVRDGGAIREKQFHKTLYVGQETSGSSSNGLCKDLKKKVIQSILRRDGSSDLKGTAEGEPFP